MPDLIAASRAADSMYVEWRRLNRPGCGGRRSPAARCTSAPGCSRRTARQWSPAASRPRLRAALLSAITEFRGTPDDVDEAVAARMSRNRILSSGNHRFVLLLEETVLRYRIGGPDVMAGQLGRLPEARAALVSLGVIPFARSAAAWPLEQFTVFDDERVHVELLSAHVTVTAPSEITLYVRAFERLADLAVYGTQARALITAAADALG